MQTYGGSGGWALAMDVRASRAADHESKAKPSSIEAASEVYQRPFFPTPVGTPGGKPQRLTASAKKERERPYSHSLVLPVGASQTPFPQKAKKDCSTHAALFVFTVRVPVHPPGGAATQQIAPPTRAPAGRGPTDARHSRRARGHHGHRAATVTPQLKRLMLTEIEDQPRLRGVPRTRRACFAFMYR